MAQPFVGEIRMFAGNFPPNGWMFCEGATIPIAENDVLFTLIGTTYGGDGQETFQLPDLQGRIPLHQGTAPEGTYQMGEKAGTESVTLTVQQIPAHTHRLTASGEAGSTSNAANALVATGPTVYRPAPAVAPMAPASITAQGGSQPHDNMQPFLCINYIISLFGLFPSPN